MVAGVKKAPDLRAVHRPLFALVKIPACGFLLVRRLIGSSSWHFLLTFRQTIDARALGFAAKT
jgi:hypothetical protein